MAAFSFYPSKNLTVYGDGGAIATSDPEIARKVTMLRNHGRKDKYLHEKSASICASTKSRRPSGASSLRCWMNSTPAAGAPRSGIAASWRA
jgi:hypothetical protein